MFLIQKITNQDITYTKEITLNNLNNIKIEIFDLNTNKLIFTKNIDIDNEYITHLLKNGIYIKR